MADRFPSLEEFGDGQTEPKGNGATNGATADDDFLARERAMLGDDANLFSTSNDNAATVEDGDDDLLGGSDSYGGGQGGGEEIDEFESSFPAMDTRNEQMGPGGTITGSNLPYQPRQPPSYSGYQEPEEEAEPVSLWRSKRDADISQREEASSSKKSDRVSKAQRDIDDFYENYNSKKDKSITRTRKEAEDFLANRQDTSAGGTSWERIGKLVDLSGKGAKGGAAGGGKEKFRELLMELRKDEKAPGASGY
ncbi:Clathrin light chain [Xanthoria parietina]